MEAGVLLQEMADKTACRESYRALLGIKMAIQYFETVAIYQM